jgi:hypothetical protein
MKTLLDPLLIIILLLLISSLGLFFGGVFPYPYGFLVLTAFLIARLLFLQQGKAKGRQDRS